MLKAMVIRNFLFHRVSEEKDAMWPPMKPSLFSAIIRHITRHYSVVSLENCLADPGAFKSRKKIATVLFDDGYKDNIECAAPILKKYNCPASFYVVTDCINRNIPTWTYIIDHIFQNTEKEKLELDLDFVPEKLKTISLNDMTARDVKPWLKKLSNPQRLLVLGSIQGQCNDVQIARDKMMNWDEVRQLISGGFTIGSHSHTHPMLASLENESEITEELSISGQVLEKETGKFPLTISYPIGSYDERVIRLSKETGYTYGLAVRQQFYRYNEQDLWSIPRVELYQEPWWKVKLRVNGFYSRVKRIWA